MTLLPFGFYDLLDQLAEPGCAICTLVRRDADKLMNSILYELVVDPPTQEHFRDSRGLCAEHGARFAEYRSALGVCVLVDQALDEVLAILKVTPARSSRSLGRLLTDSRESPLTRRLAPVRPCPVCEAQSRSEAHYATSLAQHLGDDRLDEAFRVSDGLCLPHFVATLERTEDPALAQRLADIQRGIWARLKAELDEFMRKSDVVSARGDKMDLESDSWRRALLLLGGERGVFGRNRKAGTGNS
ncbi:MAG TPA: DUF6062 family protein [Candidatus Limnocylindrales bacterium]|nr:DUF6062 family protein [Candidatus Limnocylindrales bacterium]